MAFKHSCANDTKPPAEGAQIMKSRVITSFTILVLFFPLYAAGSDFEDSSTPIEQEDMKSIDQINDESPFEDSSTPIEQGDMKSIDQVNDESPFEDSSTPIEQEDTKTIDQMN
jgi:hypothetical protein